MKREFKMKIDFIMISILLAFAIILAIPIGFVYAEQMHRAPDYGC
jgi:ABC-type phosphate/phosphonate transport system permease subunit